MKLLQAMGGWLTLSTVASDSEIGSVQTVEQSEINMKQLKVNTKKRTVNTNSR